MKGLTLHLSGAVSKIVFGCPIEITSIICNEIKLPWDTLTVW